MKKTNIKLVGTLGLAILGTGAIATATLVTTSCNDKKDTRDFKTGVKFTDLKKGDNLQGCEIVFDSSSSFNRDSDGSFWGISDIITFSNGRSVAFTRPTSSASNNRTISVLNSDDSLYIEIANFNTSTYFQWNADITGNSYVMPIEGNASQCKITEVDYSVVKTFGSGIWEFLEKQIVKTIPLQ